MSLRIYLTGRLDIETGGVLVGLRPLPGRQGRRALAYLVCERARPVPREELAEAIWQDALPLAWDTALRAIVSRLRRLCANLGQPEPTISSVFGCYQLHLPPDAWIDTEAAVAAIGQAEASLRDGAVQDAWGHALVATVIGERPFLPGEEGAWVEQRRAELHRIRVRALECVADLRLAIGEGALAVEAASEAIRLEPFRETGYQRLMRAHASLGNRAEALRTYERCRRLLADELGADPSAEIEALYLDLLRR
ncbi:MAG: BTAD domain-containing putative transcriptional regulator [Dehalococcoidia bacterium]